MREDYKNMRGKTVHGKTPEERFKEINGMTIEEWQAKEREKLKAQTGMSPEEWYIKQVTSSTPIDYLKSRNGNVSENDVELVKDLQVMGLNDGVINVLLDYVGIVSRIGVVHSLVKEMGEHWLKENIVTIERAIIFVRENWNN